ncbi:phosphoesterase, partial [mine drainage metagenome]
MKRRVPVVLVLIIALFLSAVPIAYAAPPHVVIFILENKNFSQIIGNPEAPFLNKIAKNNMIMTNYHSMTHPSLPNY